MSLTRGRITLVMSTVTLFAVSILFANAQNPRSPEQFNSSNGPLYPKGCELGEFPEASPACGMSETVIRPIIKTPEPGGVPCKPESKVINGTCDCKAHCPNDVAACDQTLTLNWVIDQLPTAGGKPCPQEPCAISNGPPCPTATATATPTKTPTATPTEIPTATPTPVSPPSQPCTLSCPDGQTLNQATCSCEPKCPPVDSNNCGQNCVPAPYPKCIECSGTCETTPITYYTADGQCLMATSWGPSESCCPKQGCDIKAHGYGDQQDESGIWYKMVNIVAACPSYPGMTGPPVKCPTCKCTDKVDCVRSDPNGDGLPYMHLDGLEPRYGHAVIRDESGTRIGEGRDQCWCVPKADACPAGYKPNSSSNPEIEYTRLENTGLLDGTTCKNPTSNQAP